MAETGPSFVFDADGDGVLNVGCNQLMLCDGQVAEVDIWLHGWDSVTQGNVSSVDYDFTWDPAKLEVLSVTCNNPAWTSYNTPSPPGSGSFDLQVSSTTGVPGTDLKLHTITFKVKDVTMPSVEGVYAVNGVVTPVSSPPAPVTTDGNIVINAICGGEPISCEAEDHCERMQDICPDTGVTLVEDRYYVEPEGAQFNEGDTVTIYHTRKGYYTVTESFDPTLCDSDCFNSCYENCAYAELHDCYLGCTRGCACELCLNWGDEEICYEYQNRIACSIKCYNTCYYSYDSENHTASYEKWCGYGINETVTLRDGDCETGNVLDSFTLEGVGTASMNRSLPLTSGTYGICAGSTPVGEVVQCCQYP